jgi:hypothetical protein
VAQFRRGVDLVGEEGEEGEEDVMISLGIPSGPGALHVPSEFVKF